MKIRYESTRFQPETLEIIERANGILAKYARRGIIITLRQLYYQFVALDLFPDHWKDPRTGSTNNIRSYKKLGDAVNKARLAGFIDWDYITDSTRKAQSLPHWNSPGDVIESAAYGYHIDLWNGQENHVEVWIEKDALASIVRPVCARWDVTFFACRGYTSQSEMWGAAQRLLKHVQAGQTVKIIHLGDHDPSGVDMTRDIETRIKGFVGHHVIKDYAEANPRALDETEEGFIERMREDIDGEFNIEINRIALTPDQIAEYNPPPNFAKMTDSRSGQYVAEHGKYSYELDALDPDVLSALIDQTIRSYLDEKLFQKRRDRLEVERALLKRVSANWERVEKWVRKLR